MSAHAGSDRFDVIILGGGPGGVAAATSAALRQKRVALISAEALMGYGLEGAYKSKTMYEIAREFYSVRTRWRDVVTGARVNFPAIQRMNHQGADRLRQVHARQLTSMGIEMIQGWGRFTDPHTISVALPDGGVREVHGEHIIIATGTAPRALRGMTPDGTHILTSDHIVSVDRPIGSILILGAGVIGSEFASIFAALGSEVLLIDTQPRIFNHDDPDISDMLARAMAEIGVDVRASARACSMEVIDGKVHTDLGNGEVAVTDAALLAVGRIPNTGSLGLAEVGVTLDAHGYIPTNTAMQTSVPHIYAVGDVGLRPTEHDLSLVHVAEAEGRTAVQHLCGECTGLNCNHVPFIVFTLPMIAGAGLNESQARQRYGDGVRVGKFAHVRNHRAHTRQILDGFVKLIVAPEGDDRVLGARAVGDGVDAVIGEVSVMIQHDFPYTHLLDSIHAHPSLSESLQGAALIISGDSPEYVEGEEFFDEAEALELPVMVEG